MSAVHSGMLEEPGAGPDAGPGSALPPTVGWHFATPMLRWHAPDAETLNDGLKAVILARRADGPEARASNVGGWQSQPDFLDLAEPCVIALRRHIVGLMRHVMALPADGDASRVDGRLGVTGWANVNGAGDFNRVHDHPGSHWSGVYYVSLGQPDPGSELNGAIEFLDPRPSANQPIPGYRAGSAMAVPPAAGEFILFPSWIQHYVMPFRGAGERISVAFNASVQGYRVR